MATFAYVDGADIDRPEGRIPVLVLGTSFEDDGSPEGIEVASVRDGNGTFYRVLAGLLIEVAS